MAKKKWIDVNERVAANMVEKIEPISYVETDMTEYIKSQFLMENIKAKRSVFGRSFPLVRNSSMNEESVFKFFTELVHGPLVMTRINSHYSIITDMNNKLMVTVNPYSTSIKLTASGNIEMLDKLEEKIKQTYDIVNCSIEWITSADMSLVTIPLIKPRGVVDQSYPFIKEGLGAFVSNYLNGPENVLILIGPPGTGKTNLIKHIIAESKLDAMTTYDPTIMAKDSIFANFAQSECGTLIFEDADNLLGRRSEGNDMMVKFLNSSDGLVSNPRKKIIFSTNLENLDDVDPALTRRGRCAGVIKFRGLTHEETINFLNVHPEIEKTWTPSDDKSAVYTLADIYNHSDANRDTGKRRAGFY